MKWLFFILMVVPFHFSWAQSVKIEINPAKPVVGETFQAYFRVFSDSEVEPVIDFTPLNIEVQGKSNQGVATRTVYANGKLTVTREINVVYDLVAKSTGVAGLRNITVKAGDQVIRHPAMTFTILKEAEEVPPVFIMADVPKKSLFVGEGILVRYYLYRKVSIANQDIKKYPKLNNFLKRFLNEPIRTERVTVDGQMYVREPIYGAKIFPEKLGELKIDPLTMSVTYMNGEGGDPFNTFNLNRQLKTRTISSETVKVNVNPLPEEGRPPGFTGLVGKHNFDLQVRNNRLIVNEPLELKLTVSGVGALESMETPKLLDHAGLEEFETNGDLKIVSADEGTKVFDYTYLAKENLQIPAKTITLSYFDPGLSSYVPVELSMPEIVVAGAAAGQPVKKKEDKKVEINASPAPTENLSELSGPMTKVDTTWRKWLPYANLALAGLSLLFVLGWFVKTKGLPSFSQGKNIPASFRKGQFDLGEFSRWVSPLIQKHGKSPIALIKESVLSHDAKTYFIDLLNSNDYKNYSSRGGQFQFVYRSQYFKELENYIESVKNESSAKS